MRKTTKGKGFLGAVVMTVLTAGSMLLLTGAILSDYFGGWFIEPFTTGVILICALLYLAVAVGVILALRQRWKEIKGGEEDEAKKY